MGVDSLAPKNPKCPRNYLLNLSAQAQKLWISMKKASWEFIVCAAILNYAIVLHQKITRMALSLFLKVRKSRKQIMPLIFPNKQNKKPDSALQVKIGSNKKRGSLVC